MITPLLASLVLSAAPAVPPDPASLALIVASNRGSRPGRAALQYADDDGAKYHHVLASLAGEENTILLTEFDRDTARLFPELVGKVHPPTRTDIRVAGETLSRRAAELRQSGRRVRFYFVFAGHGDVDDGRGFMELVDGPFTADDLQALLLSVNATEAHVVLDSCNSFFVVNPRKPGGRRFSTPREAAESLARRLPNVGVFLSTAAQAEVFEWSELQSGVFSHAVRSGLLGAADADGDGRVSYQELAAFVDTAAADIRNPLFRPKVFARGPNGEDTRAILEVSRAPHALLVVDDAAPVRLAVRDSDGLRWPDAHKEAGTTLRVWFPGGRAGALEAERLEVGESGDLGRVATYTIPGGASEPVLLASLAPSPPTLARRGVGEIFRSLFIRPFGPTALAAFASAGGLDRLPEISGDPASGSEPAAAATPVAGGDRSSARRAFSLGLRLGVASPTVSASSPTTMSDPQFAQTRDVVLAAGLEYRRWLAAEAEVGYFTSASSPWRFLVPGEIYINRQAPNADLEVQVVPVMLNLRLALPTELVRPYFLLGMGFAFESIEADPRDFNPTLREHGFVRAAQLGFGILLDLPGRLFAGVDLRAFATRSLHAFDVDFGVGAVRASGMVGWRL